MRIVLVGQWGGALCAVTFGADNPALEFVAWGGWVTISHGRKGELVEKQ